MLYYGCIAISYPAICSEGCGGHGECIQAGKCRCDEGWTGVTCEEGSYCIIMISLPSALNFFTYTVQLSVSSHANMEDFALLQGIVDVLMGGVDSIVKMVGKVPEIC